MYGSQIWGTRHLREGTEFDSRLQKQHLSFLRRVLGVKRTTSNWCVLRECGQEALQFYWFRAAVKFFNTSLDANSVAMKRVMHSDLRLSARSKDCWSAQMLCSFSGLRNADLYRELLLEAVPLNLQRLADDVRYRHQSVWREVDGLDPRVHRKELWHITTGVLFLCVKIRVCVCPCQGI
mgnify:CR=1 FL=1